MSASIDPTRLCDAYAQQQLTTGPAARQDAIVSFILGCTRMATDLKKLREHQRSWGHNPGVGESAALIESHIAEEFRYTFGRPLFPRTEATPTHESPTPHSY